MADGSNHASNGVGMRAAGDTKKLYTVNLGESNEGASTSESGGSEAPLTEVAMADVRQENGGDQVDFGGKKHHSKKQPVLTVNCIYIHILGVIYMPHHTSMFFPLCSCLSLPPSTAPSDSITSLLSQRPRQSGQTASSRDRETVM